MAKSWGQIEHLVSKVKQVHCRVDTASLHKSVGARGHVGAQRSPRTQYRECSKLLWINGGSQQCITFPRPWLPSPIVHPVQ